MPGTSAAMEGAELDPQAPVTCAPPPRLCPTCPAGASGWEPAGTSAQLPYGKEDVNRGQGAGGGQRQWALVGTSVNPRLLTSHPKGWHRVPAPAPTRCGTQGRELPIYPPRFSRGCPGRCAPPGHGLHSTEARPTRRGPGHSESAAACSHWPEHATWPRELRRPVRFCFPFGGRERMWRPGG